MFHFVSKKENKLPITSHPTKKQPSPSGFSSLKKSFGKEFSANLYTVCCLKNFRNAIILIGKMLSILSYTNTVPVEVYEDWRCINIEWYKKMKLNFKMKSL